MEKKTVTLINYRFKPGDIVSGSVEKNKTYIPLRQTHEDVNRTTSILRVSIKTPLIITDYFDKQHPGLFVKWYVMHEGRVWWLYDNEISPIE